MKSDDDEDMGGSVEGGVLRFASPWSLSIIFL